MFVLGIVLCSHELNDKKNNQRTMENVLVILIPAYWWINKFCFNSLALGRSGLHFKSAIFNLVLLIGIFRSSHAPRWMSWDLYEDKSTLVQVMAWWRQATSHYLSQCWPRSLSPYGVTRPPTSLVSTHCNSYGINKLSHQWFRSLFVQCQALTEPILS